MAMYFGPTIVSRPRIESKLTTGRTIQNFVPSVTTRRALGFNRTETKIPGVVSRAKLDSEVGTAKAIFSTRPTSIPR